MKFEEVLPALREGKKIRRKSWKREECFFVIKNGSLVDDHGYIASYYLNALLMEEDWEIVEEKKRVKLRDLTAAQYVKWRKNNCCANLCASSCPFKYINCCTAWRYHKEMYSDKFLDQEIEVEE